MSRSELETLDVRSLVALLGDPEWDVHHAAFEVLFARGAECLDALVEGIAHESSQVRLWCAELMDHLADDRCVEPLRNALNDPSPDVRRHAVHSLGCQGCKVAPLRVDVVELLRERALEDRSIRVRRVAVHQLGLQSYDPRAVEALELILRDSTDAKLLSRAQYALSMQRARQPA